MVSVVSEGAALGVDWDGFFDLRVEARFVTLWAGLEGIWVGVDLSDWWLALWLRDQ